MIYQSHVIKQWQLWLKSDVNVKSEDPGHSWEVLFCSYLFLNLRFLIFEVLIMVTISQLVSEMVGVSVIYGHNNTV